MARFLDHKQVRGAINTVVAGDDVRCAVAFWGDGALKALFGSKKRANRARIVCDLSMGGTNPDELELLGAPTNPSLKHLRGLHAKLYLSKAGMVVTSANASNRGIGFVEPPSLTECGTFYRAGTTPFRKAEEWFERLWKQADDVGPEALATARNAWAKRPRHGGSEQGVGTKAPDTLLRRIASDPVRYRGIGVAFSFGEAERQDVLDAADAAIGLDAKRRKPKLTHDDAGRLPDWPKGNLFTEWSDTDASAWPRRFLCAHRGARGALTYWCYTRFHEVRLAPDEWSIFAKPSAELRDHLEITGSARNSAKPEDELLARIFAYLDAAAGSNECSHRLCESPVHLAQLLADVDASEPAIVNPVE